MQINSVSFDFAPIIDSRIDKLASLLDENERYKTILKSVDEKADGVIPDSVQAGIEELQAIAERTAYKLGFLDGLTLMTAI